MLTLTVYIIYYIVIDIIHAKEALFIMRKTKVVLAKVLTAAMVISSFAGVQGITSEAAAKPKLSKKSVSITVGKTKKITVKTEKKYKVSWKMKRKKVLRHL